MIHNVTASASMGYFDPFILFVNEFILLPSMLVKMALKPHIPSIAKLASDQQGLMCCFFFLSSGASPCYSACWFSPSRFLQGCIPHLMSFCFEVDPEPLHIFINLWVVVVVLVDHVELRSIISSWFSVVLVSYDFILYLGDTQYVPLLFVFRLMGFLNFIVVFLPFHVISIPFVIVVF
ncbi:unnamed protein product [Vicia faba]|uniref:Uncharacterized protein n=1 Tax=Vicia faba TaxID=3906 RepID=A0AAV1A8U3_VICFA|nr:unnamed protein product [Vicia faba]